MEKMRRPNDEAQAETQDGNVQRKPSTAKDRLKGHSYEVQKQMLSPGGTTQLKGDGGAQDVHSIAAEGIASGGSALPYASQIQEAFGGHDISNVRHHSGDAAVKANQALGSEAYATGNHIASAGSMSLHTAAHEAAHHIQQKAGVQLDGGVGKAGDHYERHADAVADAVVSGQSAEGLLSNMVGGSGGGGGVMQAMSVQFIGTPLDQALPSGAAVPKYGETPGKQRRYSREQYIELWEAEQGRKMTPIEKRTIERGCIGITATNLQGGGNPLNYAEVTYGDFDKCQTKLVAMNKERDAKRARGELTGNTSAKYVMFAKMFWSNQARDYKDRIKPDPSAYLTDPTTGEVDMTGYEYRPRVKADESGTYINFDYAFWDESTQSFWHANHMEYSDPAKRASDPMKVLQSTRSKFERGYADFDRTIYCIALAENYDPGLAAISNAGGGSN